MQPTVEILKKINRNSMNNKEEVFTRLYRYLLREDIYYVAYQKLYANKGAATKGVDDDTADGFSTEKVRAIIQSLSNGTYRPKPTRRTHIPKANGKTSLERSTGGYAWQTVKPAPWDCQRSRTSLCKRFSV